MVLDASRWPAGHAGPASPGCGVTGTRATKTVNGYCKAELIRGAARSTPCKTVDDVELATLGWVHWHNTQRLHGYLADIPPTEYETTFYATHGSDQTLVAIP